MKKIETHRPQVPWSWVTWMVLPWASLTYYGLCSGAPLTFTIRKLVESPVLVSFLASINFGFNFLVGAISAYMSDRIWTRWGRRRPLLIVGWIGGATSMFLVPLADNIWVLVVLIVIFQFCTDVGTPYEPLYNEVIPPPQRGRASTLRSILNNITALFFNSVMIAQFDRDYDLGETGRWLNLNGEKAVYWVGAAGTLLAAAFLIDRVRETPPAHAISRERFSPVRFVREVFGQRQWWMVYLLYVCPLMVIGGVGTFIGSPGGAFLTLFETEQLGFSKAQIGWAAGLIGIVNMICFIPLAGYLADHLPRLRLFQCALLAPAAVNLVFFCYARFVADYTVSFAVLLGFGIASEGLMAVIVILWGPLVYDYVPTNRYGTVSAGFSFMAGVTTFVLMNGAGLWVQGFTSVFGTAGRSQYDYSSAFLWQALATVLAFCIAIRFGRDVTRGKIIDYARIEFDARQAEGKKLASE